MLKKTMTYENLDGKEVTEDFYFNMTKVELMKMQLSDGGGWEEKVRLITESENPDGKMIIDTFEEILRLSYGTRTSDGQFRKSKEDFDLFMATEAYSDLFFELVTDAKKAAEFVEALLPAKLLEDVKKSQAEVGGLKGQHPTLVSVDEHESSRFDRMVDDVKKDEPKKGTLTKDEILRKMKAKQKGYPKVLTYAEVTAMSQEDLDYALASGCTFDE